MVEAKVDTRMAERSGCFYCDFWEKGTKRMGPGRRNEEDIIEISRVDWVGCFSMLPHIP